MSLTKNPIDKLTVLNGLEEKLWDYNDWWKSIGVSAILSNLWSHGEVFSKDFLTCVRNEYGSTDDENDLEWRMVKILFLQYILSFYNPSVHSPDIDKLIKNTFEELRNTLKTDFIIDDLVPRKLPTYNSPAMVAVIMNSEDIPKDKQEHIISLLQPFLSNAELVGPIGNVYMDIENKKIDKSFKKSDALIFELAKRLIREAANRIDRARHEVRANETDLTVKDIAHCLAINALLIHKILNSENNNKMKKPGNSNTI